MQLIKTLVAAVVGATLGIGLMVALEVFAKLEFDWLVIVIGVVAGLAMRWIGGSGKASYLRGALATVVTLAAFIGGKYVVANLLLAQRDRQTVARAATDQREPSPTSDVEAEPADQELPEVVMDARPATMPSGTAMNVSPLDAIWLVLGALAAYELGKGRNTMPGTHTPGESATDATTTTTT